MYRNNGWGIGHYIVNHEKHECLDCGKHFIVGKELLVDCSEGFPICPYCGKNHVECVAWTEDRQLEELDNNMGCLAICVDTKIDPLERRYEMKKKILLIDDAECCDKCKLGFNNEYSDKFECFMEPKKHIENPKGEKPDWCPLHPLPKKDSGLKLREYTIGYADGWNACIDALERL